jgi:hypothetical protein
MGSLGAYHPNHRIQIFARWSFIFIGGYRANNLGPLPFQPHFRWACDLLPLTTQVSIPSFEHLLERGTNCLQENILESVHEHSFSSIISKLSSDCKKGHFSQMY